MNRQDTGGEPDDETCCNCGRPATTFYDDREDCPSCGHPVCEYRMQEAIDYHEERG